jgi:uncharacterized membrane protein
LRKGGLGEGAEQAHCEQKSHVSLGPGLSMVLGSLVLSETSKRIKGFLNSLRQSAPVAARRPCANLPSQQDASTVSIERPPKQEIARVRSFRGAETHARSILKAVSWRALGTLDTFAISWFMTGRIEIAGSIAGFELITKIVWYYFHERIWAAIHWGRRET